MKKMTYVGLDVHRKLIVAAWITRMNEERRMRVENSPTGWQELVAAVGIQEVAAVYEAGACGFSLYDWLTEKGWKVWVVAPTHIARSTKQKKSKDDDRDAKHLKEILTAHVELGNHLPKIWIPPMKTREDRQIVRRRLDVAEDLARVKNRLNGMMRHHRIETLPEFKTPWSKKHVAWLWSLTEEGSAIAEPIRWSLASSLRELEFYQKEVRILDQHVRSLAGQAAYKPAVEEMTKVKGVGILTALSFLLEIGDPQRFSNRGQIGSFLGLVPSSHSSGEDERHGHITRMGPGRVRKLLNQAVWAWIRNDDELRRWYAGVAYRSGKKKKAVVGLMRKLGIELWRRAKGSA